MKTELLELLRCPKTGQRLLLKLADDATQTLSRVCHPLTTAEMKRLPKVEPFVFPQKLCPRCCL